GIHHTIPRRLVAEGDRVYVTLQFLDSAVSVLDAATGETITEALPGTKGTDEIILSGGVLVAKTTKKRSVAATARIGAVLRDNALAAVDVETGRQLWRKEGVCVLPYALSAADGRVVYHNMEEIVCLDARTGREAWRAPNPTGPTVGGVSNLVVHDGVVLFHGHGKAAKAAPAPAGGKGKKRKPPRGRTYLTAFSLDDGSQLWRKNGSSGRAAACTQPADVFVANGVVWYGSSLNGLDLRTGEVRKTLKIGKLITPGHHYRCHRSKATVRYLIWPKRGAEFAAIDGGDHMRADWLRAPCFTGPTPANGLFYAPTDQCFCYPGVKYNGYLAMSAERHDELEPSGADALERGPAYGRAGAGGATSPDDWPMHRRDGLRSGWTKAAVPARPGKRWEKELACRGTQPVVVGERLWIAERDAHQLRCLDAATGRDVWSFTAGGRIDSTPTYHEGTLIFGSRDGWVYCLRAADGVLAWRFRAAPSDRRIVAFEQVESLWPVHGSVLVQEGVAYFAAGRSSFLDGGIMVYGLDAATGKVRHHHRLEGPWPDINKDASRPFAMEGALSDLMVSDGTDLYMMRIKFDSELGRIPVKRESALGELDMGAVHLSATGGFLDDTGYDRIYWMHGRRWPGFNMGQHSPKAGQLVVFDDSTTYAVKYFYRRHQWSPLFIPGEKGYLLFADDSKIEPVFLEKGKKALDWLPPGGSADRYRKGGRGTDKGTGFVRAAPEKWQTLVPLRIRAMVLAGDRLFAAGTPDVIDPKDPLAAFEGRAGASLAVFSARDGSKLSEMPLGGVPAFDGMSAAHGRLYLTTEDGRLVCMGER
ncbi:MAG: outer membrane protein assembly factor BamB family protein, partial [Planctomycetota bacterium]